ncbi:MAG: class I SAM-dependent methyltransferase [Anaerolineaceae bacterium]|jgi:SAM-dependent methyltransferase|nr:MAG: class I SAM-dependent methyltransferase [Anaerolineaceae bacterium]
MNLIPEQNLEKANQLGMILDYYETTDESARLQRLESELELLRTRDILARNLPPVPADVLDVGGGPAVHSYWLSMQGYRTHLVDLVPRHIEMAEQMAPRFPSAPLLSMTVGDARQLNFSDQSVNVVVMLGPLYHLVRSADRHAALREAWRVLRPGGILIAEAISRYVPLVKVLTRDMLTDARLAPIVTRTLHTGQHRPDPDLDFFTTAFFHHPSGLKREVTRAGFVPGNLFAVEGPVRLLKDFGQHWQIRERREWLLGLARQLEQEHVLLGVSGHMILTATKLKGMKRG